MDNFAFEAAKRLKKGSLHVDDLKQTIINAANEARLAQGAPPSLLSMKDVQLHGGATAYMWFEELKRVSQHEDCLDELIQNKGRGLSTLYKRIGPSQAQRRKGFSHPTGRYKLICDRVCKGIAALESALLGLTDYDIEVGSGQQLSDFTKRLIILDKRLKKLRS